MLKFFKKNKEEKTSLLANSKKSSDTKFYQIKVKEVRREIEDAVSVAFDIPEGLMSTFTFSPGQYVTLKTNVQGEELRRSYSICSAPHEGELRVAIKQIEGGKFSTYANQTLKEGDSLEAANGKLQVVSRHRAFPSCGLGSRIWDYPNDVYCKNGPTIRRTQHVYSFLREQKQQQHYI